MQALPKPPYDPDLLCVDPSLMTPLLTDAVFTQLRALPEMTVDAVQPLLDKLDLEHEERRALLPDGPITLSILRPKGANGPLPCLYDVHGGGMVLSNRFSGMVPETLALVAEHQLVMVSPEYTLAPEARAPQAALECHAALGWLAQHADDLGIEAHRLVLAGGSGGAGIAAAVALLNRDRGGPALTGLLLRCPMLDDRHTTVSSRQFAASNGAFDPWPSESNRYAWDLILGEGHEDRDVTDYESPGRARDLSGLPPTFVDVGSSEVFRDAAVAFASRVWEGGGVAELHVWPGAYHASDFFVPTAPISEAALAARSRWLHRLLLTA